MLLMPYGHFPGALWSRETGEGPLEVCHRLTKTKSLLVLVLIIREANDRLIREWTNNAHDTVLMKDYTFIFAVTKILLT